MTTVAALTFATETVVPALVGVLLLGDQVVPGRGPLAAAAFVATLGGCITLAGCAEPTQPTSLPGPAGRPRAMARRPHRRRSPCHRVPDPGP